MRRATRSLSALVSAVVNLAPGDVVRVRRGPRVGTLGAVAWLGIRRGTARVRLATGEYFNLAQVEIVRGGP
jgi:hypothetical protein